MTSKSIATEEWTCFYDAENQLTRIEKNNQLISEYGYDGDGKRVWAKDYESSGAQKETIYIGNYFESVREDEDARQGEGGYVRAPIVQIPVTARTVRGFVILRNEGS